MDCKQNVEVALQSAQEARDWVPDGIGAVQARIYLDQAIAGLLGARRLLSQMQQTLAPREE